MRRTPLTIAVPMAVAIAVASTTQSLLASEDPPPAPPLTATAGQSFQIESVAHPGKLVRPEDANSRDGTPIVLYPKTSWKCMTWKFDAAADVDPVKVGFKLVNHFTHKTLAAGPVAKGDTAPVIERPAGTDAPKWTFTRLDDGLYRIEQSGRALTATDDGGLVVGGWKDVADQKWRLLPKPEHFTG